MHQNPFVLDSPMRQIPFHSRLGRRLRDARRSTRTSQADLARRVGCSVPTLRQAELGQGGVAVFLSAADGLGLELAGRSLPPGENLGARLRALRQRQRLSQRDLAATAQCSPTTVAAVERNVLGHLAVLERVGEALGAGLTLVGQGRQPTFVGNAATSSAHHGWETPPDFLERLYPLVTGRFDLDPCSPGKGRSRVRARTHYTEEDDGLSLPWHGKAFMNPPYGKALPAWTAKAHAEIVAGHASLVLGLIPARTDTRWWHRDVAGVAHVWLLKGRLAFGDGTQSAPFPSALIVWGGSDDLVQRISTAFPDAQHVPRRAAVSFDMAAE